jgi:hypothetical protein
MTSDTSTSTSRVASGEVAQHDCADHGCLAAMFGLDLGDTAGVQTPVAPS